MDKKTLYKIIKICENRISRKVIESHNCNGDITDSVKNDIKVYVNAIDVMEEILDNLEEDSTYYDGGELNETK